MPSTLPVLVSQVTFGGTAADNPTNYDPNSYINYPGLPGGQSYVRQNVIYDSPRDNITYQVTGLLVVGPCGKPLIGPSDLCYCPCPPLCTI